MRKMRKMKILIPLTMKTTMATVTVTEIMVMETMMTV